ncbi:MAG: hypothetical protein M3O70_17085 [Actinomycetota bacterium]|nr:hypothetical protein [Actinomycetota bacterium]
MTQTLKAALLDSSKRPQVVEDLVQMVDAEVDDKGIAIKSGYGVVKKVKPGIISDAVDSLLDEFIEKLEPFYAEFAASGSGSLGDYFSSRSDEVADALLSVTDARAERSSRESIKKVYDKLRPSGKKNVEEALPRLGAVIQKHTA